MRLGYNTNGFAHHRLEDALDILAQLGYQSIALTLDYHVLNPFDPDLSVRTAQLREQLRQRNLRCVVETGARFLLDPRRKHWPTLLSVKPADVERRLDFLIRSIDLAAALDADAVSFWSGSSDGSLDNAQQMAQLVDACRRLCAHAERKGVRLAFEPEPGMFIDTMSRFAELVERVDHPAFGLTLDVGHLHCQGEGSIAEHIHRWQDRLWNIHIEDMRLGVHDHLMFGEGEIDFPPILRALQEIGYTGGVHVELSRHSHDAVRTAAKALAFLQKIEASGG